MRITPNDTLENESQRQVGRYLRGREQFEKSEDETLALPAHGSYGHLLFDQRWRSKRSEIMARDKQCCVICKGADELQVHHRQYQYVKAAKGFKVPWEYPDHLLITLCKSCHQRGHSKFKVPIIIV